MPRYILLLDGVFCIATFCNTNNEMLLFTTLQAETKHHHWTGQRNTTVNKPGL